MPTLLQTVEQNGETQIFDDYDQGNSYSFSIIDCDVKRLSNILVNGLLFLWRVKLWDSMQMYCARKRLHSEYCGLLAPIFRVLLLWSYRFGMTNRFFLDHCQPWINRLANLAIACANNIVSDSMLIITFVLSLTLHLNSTEGNCH
jgi:hypothetical protein